MPRYLKILINTLFWICLISGPAATICRWFSIWSYPDYQDNLSDFFRDYLNALPIFTIAIFFVRKRAAILPFLFYIFSNLICFSPLWDFTSSLGFRFHIGPVDAYIQQHCHPESFEQDGKQYYIGFCDLDIDPTGEFSSPVVMYDTSGDVRNDYDLNTDAHVKDRREWVNAIRKYLHDDVNDDFELWPFHTTHLWGPLYEVWSDDSPGGGFSFEYGFPPYNKENRYIDQY